MPIGTAYRNADQLAAGELHRILKVLRKSGASYADISRRLYAEHSITASIPTIAKWCRELGIEAAS